MSAKRNHSSTPRGTPRRIRTLTNRGPWPRALSVMLWAHIKSSCNRVPRRRLKRNLLRYLDTELTCRSLYGTTHRVSGGSQEIRTLLLSCVQNRRPPLAVPQPIWRHRRDSNPRLQVFSHTLNKRPRNPAKLLPFSFWRLRLRIIRRIG